MKKLPCYFGPYRLVEFLGVGATSEVYRAEQPGFPRSVALKLLLPTVTNREGWIRRFQREATVIRKLQHPNIVGFLDFGELDGAWFLAMELCVGRSLRALVGQRLHLPVLARLGVQLADGLDSAHRLGLVHRDIKPENMILPQEGGVKILDWGLARTFEWWTGETDESLNDVTATGIIVGPPRYMSPEQTRAETLNPASDIFSLGICLFELAARRHPFPAISALEVMEQIRNSPAPTLDRTRPDLPEPFGLLIGQMLSKNPSDRPTSAEVRGRLIPLLTT